MTQALITAKNLAVRFDNKTVFENVSFTIDQGDFFCIEGPNGAGKTTLLKVITHDLTPSAGTLDSKINDSDMGYVPQFRNIPEDFPLSARSFVELKLYKRIWPWFSHVERAEVTQALASSHLTNKQNLRVGQMSGGEKQRAYLAQAIVSHPKLLILDEPTASLDVEAKYKVMDVVQELNKKGTTVIFISHDPDLLKKYGTKRIELAGEAE